MRHWPVFPETRYENLIKHRYYFCLLALCQWKKEKIWWWISGTRSLVIFWGKFDQKYKKEKCIYDLKWPWKHPSDFHPQKDQTHCYQATFFPYKTRRTLSYHVKRENKPQITILTINNKYKQKFITACVMRLFRVT